MSSTSVNTTDSTPVGTTRPSSPEVAQANLYHVLSKAFASPLEMGDDAPAPWRRMIPEWPAALQGVARCVADEWERALEDREVLTLAYTRLFLGPFEILAPPYASFYLEPDQRLMGEVSEHVARVYAEAGLEPGSGPREVPDHVALEWEFLYYLTHQYVMTGEEHWLKKREAFRSTHLNHWMPRFVEAITKAAEHPFYDALAAFLNAWLNEPETD